MLNRIHAGLARPHCALRAVCVRCHFAAQAMRVCHDRLHLFDGVLRCLRVVALRQHAAGRADLDEVGPVLDVLANLLLHLRNAIRHAVCRYVIFERQQILIAVAAGNAQRGTAHLHVWPGKHARFDVISQRDIRSIRKRQHCEST